MTTREDLMLWVLEALRSRGGSATVVEVCAVIFGSIMKLSSGRRATCSTHGSTTSGGPRRSFDTNTSFVKLPAACHGSWPDGSIVPFDRSSATARSCLAFLPKVLRLLTLAGFLLLQGILIALSIPFLYGRIAPNRTYGLRTRDTFASDAAWYRANRFSATHSIATSAVLCLAGVLLYRRDGIDDWALFWILLALLVGGVIWDGVVGMLRARHIAREEDARAATHEKSTRRPPE
jgi:hypothetical protein